MNSILKSNFGFSIALLMAGLALASCQRRSGKSLSSDLDGDLPIDGGSNGTLSAGLGNLLGGGGGNLSSNERSALSAVATGVDEVSPATDAALSAGLMDEAKRLIDEEKRGYDVSVKKSAFLQKVFASCGNNFGELYPRPGQTLVGNWRGTTCAVKSNKTGKTNTQPTTAGTPISFDIVGDGLSGPYRLQGDIKAQMGARPDGSAIAQGNPWSGEFVEQPTAGHGTLYNPKFLQHGSTYDSCEMGVTLAASRNPIPEQYIEAMRRMGQCMRSGLAVMMLFGDEMFSNMDPQLANLLQTQMLGIH